MVHRSASDIKEFRWGASARDAAEVLDGRAAEGHPDDVEVTPAALLAAAAEHL